MKVIVVLLCVFTCVLIIADCMSGCREQREAMYEMRRVTLCSIDPVNANKLPDDGFVLMYRDDNKTPYPIWVRDTTYRKLRIGSSMTVVLRK